MKIEYDENIAYFKYLDKSEKWYTYDKKANKIYDKDNLGNESWYKYDKNNERIEITQQEFKQIERTKVLFNNKRINRFSLMDI